MTKESVMYFHGISLVLLVIAILWKSTTLAIIALCLAYFGT